MSARIPASTYRIQLGGAMTFRAVSALLPYLRQLGVDACYLSPALKATPGTAHGYDICDHNALSPELGGDDEFSALAAELSRHGLGLIVDFVPNHMGIDPRTNQWWHDVLENGPSSPYATFFDIDWDPVTSPMQEKILLPVLGDQYGLELERGHLQLAFEAGTLRLQYFDHEFPINPRQAPQCYRHGLEPLRERLGADHPELREFLSVLTALQNLPPYTERDALRIEERQREKEVARERLARLVGESAEIRAHIDAAVAAFNGRPGDGASFDLLHELLESQAWRLAYWRTAFDEVNYRRFFDINELAALRMEDPRVFGATHQLLQRLIAGGAVTGVRVDHPDGLHDPEGYFTALQRLSGEDAASRPIYLLAEKILERSEELPDWPVHGTTGYEVLNLLNGLFVDGRQVRALLRIHAAFTRRRFSFADEAWDGKRTIMVTSLASELNVLSQAVFELARQNRRTRDFTLTALRRALLQVIASFPVYRTYLRPGSARDADRRAIAAAIADARRRNPAVEQSVFDFLGAVLWPMGALDRHEISEVVDDARLALAMRVQQLTAPVQAKGVEDTAFYRYGVLLSANEVGGDPAHPAVAPDAFHQAIARLRGRWPYGMTATATHDTKRGEDARARLNVLSEVAGEWRTAVAGWRRMNAARRRGVGGGPAPDGVDEYHFYQALLAAWPMDALIAGTVPPDLADRLALYMRKAMREAKRHTSWLSPDAAYEEAVLEFVAAVLTGSHAQRFVPSFLAFARRVAGPGAVNALGQVVLRLTLPGVPDTYQGTELWDTSLVDPDNRRPVDFDDRQAALDALEPALGRLDRGEDASAEVAALLGAWPDGRIKLWTLTRVLRLRRAERELFLDGRYVPLSADGPRAEHVVAFAREDGGRRMIVVVPRLTATLAAEAGWPVGNDAWGDTTVECAALDADPMLNLLTGETVPHHADGGGGTLRLADILRTLPVALLAPRRVAERETRHVA
jgi:(1->4)-alpha-D-glucan 1-alpha-D-glucosylmutase